MPGPGASRRVGATCVRQREQPAILVPKRVGREDRTGMGAGEREAWALEGRTPRRG